MYIMLVDLDEMSREAEQMSRLYVAITRANAVLWIAVPEDKSELFEEIKGENLEKMIGAS